MEKYLHPQPSLFRELPFRVNCIGVNMTQGSIDRTSGYPDAQWLFCMDGEGELVCNNQVWRIGVGTGFFLPSGLPHLYKPVKEPWVTHFVAFAGSGVPSFLAHAGWTNCCVQSFHDINHIDKLLQRIFYHADSQHASAGNAMSTVLYQFLIELSDIFHFQRKPERPDPIKRIQPLLDVLPERCHEMLTLEMMADIIQVSPQYLCRLFHETLRIRPVEYLTQCRIRKAQELLSSPRSIPISDISLQCGFESFSYFCTVFKKQTGLTPGTYRRMF